MAGGEGDGVGGGGSDGRGGRQRLRRGKGTAYIREKSLGVFLSLCHCLKAGVALGVGMKCHCQI